MSLVSIQSYSGDIAGEKENEWPFVILIPRVPSPRTNLLTGYCGMEKRYMLLPGYFFYSHLIKIGLTNPFTFKSSPSYNDWIYKNNKEDQWKKISNPEQLAFFFVLNNELNAFYREFE